MRKGDNSPGGRWSHGSFLSAGVSVSPEGRAPHHHHPQTPELASTQLVLLLGLEAPCGAWAEDRGGLAQQHVTPALKRRPKRLSGHQVPLSGSAVEGRRPRPGTPHAFPEQRPSETCLAPIENHEQIASGKTSHKHCFFAKYWK